MSNRFTRPIGTRYFHSSVRIWSIRRRGKVHLIHMSSQTTKKALPKNQRNPGMQSITALKPSQPGMCSGIQPPRKIVAATPEMMNRLTNSAT